jgi:hypothetical protein
VHSSLNAYCELQLTSISDDQPHQWQAKPRKSRRYPAPARNYPQNRAGGRPQPESRGTPGRSHTFFRSGSKCIEVCFRVNRGMSPLIGITSQAFLALRGRPYAR